MANITWKIVNLQCLPEQFSQTDVVCFASWVCEAEENGNIGHVSGVVKVNYTGGEFTPFNSLTQDQVLAWCWAEINKESVEGAATYDLQSKIKAASIQLKETLPWQQ